MQFAQFYNDPYQLNPALSGASKYNRAGIHYRDQWPGINEAYKSYAGFLDKRIRGVNSGVGMYLLHDVAGTGALTFSQLKMSYSYGVKLHWNHGIRFGVSAALSNRSVDFNRLLFADQVLRDMVPTSIEGFESNQVTYVDFGAGMEYTHIQSGFRFGISAEHLNQPNQSFSSIPYNLPVRLSVYALYDHYLRGDFRSRDPVYISYGALYKLNHLWDQLDFGGVYHYGKLEFGLFYRGIPGLKQYLPGYSNNAAVIAYTGYQFGNVHLGYNYDFTISKLGNAQSHGAHEVTLIAAFGQRIKKRNRGAIPCPDILGGNSFRD